jgi:Fatty acid desaturase
MVPALGRTRHSFAVSGQMAVTECMVRCIAASEKRGSLTTVPIAFWVALMTFGEGWHNNHHAHPQSSRHGLAWYELDLNWYVIATLRMFGLAWR